jgi:hypothetical protein
VLGDYAPKRELDININSINEFIELREIEPRIRKIYSSSDFKQLEETQKTAIEKILEEMDRKSEESF